MTPVPKRSAWNSDLRLLSSNHDRTQCTSKDRGIVQAYRNFAIMSPNIQTWIPTEAINGALKKRHPLEESFPDREVTKALGDLVPHEDCGTFKHADTDYIIMRHRFSVRKWGKEKSSPVFFYWIQPSSSADRPNKVMADNLRQRRQKAPGQKAKAGGRTQE